MNIQGAIEYISLYGDYCTVVLDIYFEFRQLQFGLTPHQNNNNQLKIKMSRIERIT